MFFEEGKSFPPAAKSLLTIQEVDASLTRLAQLTKEDDQQKELEDISKK
jgi:DNA ligase-3